MRPELIAVIVLSILLGIALILIIYLQFFKIRRLEKSENKYAVDQESQRDKFMNENSPAKEKIINSRAQIELKKI
jgi:flagellar biosynthesis/type III secretory pathway M-ring protein FliF/YscJ